MTLLLTRPGAQGERFARDFAARFGGGIRVILSPLQRIAPRAVVPDLAGVTGLIFTSANAVTCFADLCADRRFPAYCVGARTAQAARQIGLDAVECGPDAAGLVVSLSAQNPGGRLLHLRGAHARGAVAETLTKAGQPCDDLVVYDQISQKLSLPARQALAGTAPVLLPLFSPRSATLMAQAAQGAPAPLALAALSPAVREAWTGPTPIADALAARPDTPAMLDALSRLIDAVLRLEGGRRPS
ncbi:uroporphyrinogen-III synthase [Actibacterium sp. D379-3]